MLQSAPVAGFLLLFCQCTFRMLKFPFMWKQFQQFLMSSLFVIGHSGDDIIQIIPWVYIMCLTGGQQGTDHRHISRCLMVAAEKVIFPSQSNRPDDIFSQIVIPEQASVLQTSHHVVPSGIGIRDGFPDLGIGAVLDSFRFHPHFHGIHARSGQFPALRLPLVVRQPRLIAAVFNPVNMLYLGQAMFGNLPVFIQSLFKMTADMHQTVEQPHVGVGPERCLIACKTVALKITLEMILICQGFDDRSGTRSLIVMEDDQFLHDRPYHPQVFLVSLVLFPVDDRNGSLARHSRRKRLPS